MKIITCFIPASEGKAEVCGHAVEENSLEVRKHIGYLPEHNPLYKEMYVREYLELVARIYKLKNRKSRIDELIEKTGLTAESGKKIEFLSKGYRQRVGLAQAMMNDPDILILDEPTSGLDPNQLVDIRSLIKDLGKEKLVLFSSHIMQEVQALCDRVIILNEGKLVADDPIDLLANRVKGGRQISIEFKKPIDIEHIQSISGVQEVKKGLKNTYEIFANTDQDIREELFDLAVKHNNKLLALTQDELSIESIFQKVTKSQN